VAETVLIPHIDAVSFSDGGEDRAGLIGWQSGVVPFQVDQAQNLAHKFISLQDRDRCRGCSVEEGHLAKLIAWSTYAQRTPGRSYSFGALGQHSDLTTLTDQGHTQKQDSPEPLPL
jgi:hypothetical protein